MNSEYLLLVGIAAVAVALALMARPVPVVALGDPVPDEGMPEITAGEWLAISPVLAPAVDPSKNVRAFLDMIAFAEGTAGDRGYQTMFGYRYFTSFADHPRQYFTFTNLAGEVLTTSAAGRYQFIVKTWDGVRATLGLPDFSPASQDAGAIELIRQRGALADVQGGRFAVAVAKCAKEWASLPGAGYSQPERKFSQLTAAYEQAGGQLA